MPQNATAAEWTPLLKTNVQMYGIVIRNELERARSSVQITIKLLSFTDFQLCQEQMNGNEINTTMRMRTSILHHYRHIYLVILLHTIVFGITLPVASYRRYQCNIKL